jgi:hypothetical protein
MYVSTAAEKPSMIYPENRLVVVQNAENANSNAYIQNKIQHRTPEIRF